MKKPVLLVILIVVAAAAGAWFASNLRTSDSPVPALKSGTALAQPQPLPSAALISHEGNAVDSARLEGEWSLLFFGFTHCPDVCPTTLTLLGDVRRRMGANAPRVVLVSVDPERDTPQVMAQYLQGFDPAILGLTGSPQAIATFAAALGVAHRKIPMGETYMVDHTAALFAIDPQGRRVAVFTPPLDAGQIAGDLALLAASRG
jgi:protein SCO1